MATHSSILAWRILWIEETCGLQSMGRKELDTTERLSLSEAVKGLGKLFPVMILSFFSLCTNSGSFEGRSVWLSGEQR